MVDKITGPITPLGEINKINEIIDNLDSGVTVDQTYNASSANAQSGVAINGAKFIRNTARGSNALTVGGTASGYTGGTNIGISSQAKQNYSTALGYNTNANGNSSTCIGRNAGTSAASAIQIGAGVNSTANTLQVGFIHANTNYQLLDGTTGKIPNDRIKYDGTTITVNSNGELTSTGSGGATRNIGEIVASTTPLTDAGLHLLDGALISGSGSYSAFVTHIAGLVSTYPNLFVTESAWQRAVSTYGVCGKFVYNSTKNTVRLPKYNSKIYTGGGTAPVVGNGLTLGLVGKYNGSVQNAGLTQGQNAIYFPYDTYGTAYGSSSNLGTGSLSVGSVGVSTDADKSGLVAQLSDITTSLDGYYYIVVATSTKTDIQVDIDEIATDLNNKADLRDMAEVQCVVETYRDGYSWYRIWSDGWLEQGGPWGQNNAAYVQYTVNFMKNFANMNYTLFVQGNWSDATATSCRIDERTLSGFKGIMANNLYSTMPSYWYACGTLGI